MASVDISGFRCTNHAVAVETLASGVFDVDNPCSWCKNREHAGRPGPAFHYVEFGRWEFPFIAEANCANFSLIIRPGAHQIDPAAWRLAKETQEKRNKAAELGRQYVRQWLAYQESEAPLVGATTPRSGRVLYPHDMGAVAFFREISQLRTEFFALKQELIVLVRQFRDHLGVRETNLDQWLASTSQTLSELARQIDELESKKEQTCLAIVSRWAVSNVAGNALWDSLKMIGRALGEVLQKGTV